MSPYFSEAGISIYHGRWEEVWSALGLSHENVALLWADPPYGVNERTERGSAGRNGKGRFKTARSRDVPRVVGDDRPFEPAPLLAFPRAVLWGANHYGSRLPDASCWFVWDKREGTGVNDNADCELAWTNLSGPARTFHHMWNGCLRATERATPREHPTQEPVALASWGFQRAGLKRGDLVFSPYLGSGPEARAAMDMGLRFIGCEVVEQYCEAAANRLRQRTLFGGGL